MICSRRSVREHKSSVCDWIESVGELDERLGGLLNIEFFLCRGRKKPNTAHRGAIRNVHGSLVSESGIPCGSAQLLQGAHLSNLPEDPHDRLSVPRQTHLVSSH